MNKMKIRIAAILGFAGVAAGAFGAHALKNYLTPEMIEIYKTGVLYHLVHSCVLLFLALNDKYNFRISFTLILLGIIFFSFSLYLYSVFAILLFAMITPVGGLLLLAGWLFIFIEAGKQK